MPYQLEKARSSAPCSHPTSVPFYFWDFPEKRICADTPKAIKWLENISVGELGPFSSQLSDKAIADAEERLSAGGGLAKRVQTESFGINAADGHPRLGMTDDIVNLLCHFVGN